MAEQQVVEFVRATLSSLIRQIEHISCGNDNLDGILYHLDWLYNSIVRYFQAQGQIHIHESVITLVGNAYDILAQNSQNLPHPYTVEQISNGRRGRPKLNITRPTTVSVRKRFYDNGHFPDAGCQCKDCRKTTP